MIRKIIVCQKCQKEIERHEFDKSIVMSNKVVIQLPNAIKHSTYWTNRATGEIDSRDWWAISRKQLIAINLCDECTKEAKALIENWVKPAE